VIRALVAPLASARLARVIPPRTLRHAAALALAVAASIASPTNAAADPSIWSQARSADQGRLAVAVADAEALQLKYRHIARLPEEDRDGVGKLFLRQARVLLEGAGAASSPDPLVRYQLAEILHELRDDAPAARLFETVVAIESTPPSVRAEAYSQLAEAYTRLGRFTDEIRAYDAALRFEPQPFARSRLLANRAESYMALGDITAAVTGYREAMGLLSAPIELFTLGPTTLWGLAVALDRSGDLDGALEAIRLARTYDPLDKNLNGPGWFYVPAYDRYYYQALGHWSAARHASLSAARSEEYLSAIAHWQEYLDRAAPDDRWIGVARARLRQNEKERDADARARKASARGK
jgi:tetratricopeptide (TPR) repeat protein